MDFINRNFSRTFKIMLTVISALIFIRILPLIVVVGFIVWGGNKGIKYFKNKKTNKSHKYGKENINIDSSAEKDDFNFAGKNIIDVEYEEIK